MNGEPPDLKTLKLFFPLLYDPDNPMFNRAIQRCEMETPSKPTAEEKITARVKELELELEDWKTGAAVVNGFRLGREEAYAAVGRHLERLHRLEIVTTPETALADAMAEILALVPPPGE